MHPNFWRYILFMGLIGLNNHIFAQRAIAQTPINSPQIQPSIPNQPNLSQPLWGQWEAKDPLTGDILRLVFTPEGKFYTLIIPAGVSESSKIPTLELAYQVNSQSKPQQIDIISLKNGQRILSIWELTKDGKLRLDFGKSQPGTPRPTTFGAGTILLEKTAASTELPANIQIYNPTSNSASSVKQDIDLVNREQTIYFLENNEFANTIQQLGVKIPLVTDDYIYQLQVSSDKTGKVVFTAKAKKANLNSYVGAVFEYKSKEREKTIASIICETDVPTQTLPNQPTLVEDIAAPIRCATGSHPTQP
ncbi:type IV pilin-like G/H family protein [Merismopedia glauca]|uniref:Uncharacterized protein n=1 Tax=Merismopedia glauca CCAP 1448/3 TaxID=1296344 RepID=A0A2T1C9B2_9CYAN|nr:type IV pilin-like G/H family protein [Merismopedia glauca]PSB04831.1 hypothetical protein C7B64_02405 [Merismopedia glauca CCAP 1448/3]